MVKRKVPVSGKIFLWIVLGGIFPVMAIVNNFAKYAINGEKKQEVLNEILPDHLSLLENFTRRLFCHEDFAYTLFNAKAIAMEVCTSQIANKKITLFKKYLHLFNSDKFIFKETIIDNARRRFIFINKSLFLKTVAGHIQLFRSELGESISPESLLAEIENSNKDIMEVLHHHEGLFGILLGYGKKNALIYHRRDCIRRSLASAFSLPFQASDHKNTALIEEIKRLDKLLYIDSPSDDILLFVKPLAFAGKKDLETKKLRCKYETAQERISNSLYGRNLLFTILQQIHSADKKCVQKKLIRTSRAKSV